MSLSGSVERDERTVAVEGAGGRWAYLFLSYCLLLDVAYRSFARREAAWDLLALVIAAGVVFTVYQARHKVLSRSWLTGVLVAVGLAAVIAAALALGA
jgi:hypothetical protein